MKKFFLPAILAALAFACNNASEKEETTDTTQVTVNDTGHAMQPDSADQPFRASATVVLSGTKTDTTVTGQAQFDTIPGGKVRMSLEVVVSKMATKTVAVHLHEHGDCGDQGNASHGHWNPGNKAHGQWGKGEFHAGDIGNVSLDRQGRGMLTLETDLWTIGGPAASNILGRALIVHSGVDDYKTQPTGNAGSRIGCGVIQ